MSSDEPTKVSFAPRKTEPGEIERIQQSHAEMVAAQSWQRFWRAGHAARYDQLSPFQQKVVVLHHGWQPAESLWRFADGLAISVGLQ